MYLKSFLETHYISETYILDRDGTDSLTRIIIVQIPVKVRM